MITIVDEPAPPERVPPLRIPPLRKRDRFAATINGARVDIDNRRERCARPECSPCCRDAYYPRVRGGRIALACLGCDRDFAEANRGGLVTVHGAPRV